MRASGDLPSPNPPLQAGERGREADGRMAEWFKAAVLKTAVGATPP